jgi:hypothetical protein
MRDPSYTFPINSWEYIFLFGGGLQGSADAGQCGGGFRHGGGIQFGGGTRYGGGTWHG